MQDKRMRGGDADKQASNTEGLASNVTRYAGGSRNRFSFGYITPK